MSFSPEKTVRILSLDGGGVRGVIPETFLKRFCPSAGVNPAKIYESFDLVIGTSIGGLLTLGHCKGKTPDDMIQFFYDQGATIFYYNPGLLSPTLATYKANVIMGTPTYNYTFYGVGSSTSPDDPSINGLKIALTSVLGDTTKLSDLPGNLILTAWDADEDKSVLFSNITQFPNYLIGADVLAVSAGLATSAAPLYFPSSTIEGHTYIDGGVYQNNPEMIAYAVGKQMFPTSNRFCILSLGTGIFYNDFIPPTLLKASSDDPVVRDFHKELVKVKRKLIENYPDQQEKIRLLTANAQDNSILPYNVDYLFYLMENVFIPGPQEATAKLMQFMSEDIFDDIFHYRFQYEFLEGQDSSLDNYASNNLDALIGYANAQYDSDILNINTFIQHFIVG